MSTCKKPQWYFSVFCVRLSIQILLNLANLLKDKLPETNCLFCFLLRHAKNNKVIVFH